MSVKKLFQPQIIVLVLLYTIVAFSFWPLIIWICAILIIVLCELILHIKEYLVYLMSSDSFRNAPVVYTRNKDNNSNDSVDIDWSKFDISNYPKKNYRKVYWEHRPFIYKNIEYRYPYADVIVMMYTMLFTILSYIEWISGKYSLMRVFILSGFLCIVFFIYISFAGKKFYEDDCKEEFLYYYNCDMMSGEKSIDNK